MENELPHALVQLHTLVQSLSWDVGRQKELTPQVRARFKAERREAEELLVYLDKEFALKVRTQLIAIDRSESEPFTDGKTLENLACEIQARLDECRSHVARATAKPYVGGLLAEARDKWIYEQCHVLPSFGDVRRNLDKLIAKQPKRAKWMPIGTDNAIRNAANKYAQRHGLESLAARRAGSKSRT